MIYFSFVILLLQSTSVHVRGLTCQFGREDINIEGTVAEQGRQYLDLQHPLTCSGSIVAWHFCFYTDNVDSTQGYHAYLRVYRNDSNNVLQRVHQVNMDVRLSSSQVGSDTFMCMGDILTESAYLNVSMGDYLAVYIPTLSEALQIVGDQVPQSMLYRDTRPFLQPFTRNTVQFVKLQRVDGGFLHLQADIVSPDGPEFNNFSPQPTTVTSLVTSSLFSSPPTPTPTPQLPVSVDRDDADLDGTTNTTETNRDDSSGGIDTSGIAAIATIASLLFLLALLVIFLALGIVVHRTWKVKQMKKTLLEIRPPHLAMDNATYELPMVVQNYRLSKSVKNGKSGGSGRERTGRLSTASENIYESHYDEGIAEVFGLYATLMPSSAEFRSSIRKVVSTLSKTKPTPYQLPAVHEEQIYQQISGQKVPSLSAADIQTVGQLGSGQFANVEKAVWAKSHAIIEVAVKTLHSDASSTDKVKFLQEGAITSQFRHPNVIFLYGIIVDKNKVSLVMEYISEGDLKGCLMKIRANPDAIEDMAKLLLSYSSQVALGMLYLSDKGFVHRDLAARNILVSDKDVCKIADFGMSRDLADAEYYISEGGTIPIRWTAPEAVYYRKYSSASDVWSYGCVLYEIWSIGHKPFEGCSNTRVLREISIGFRLPPPPGCPQRTYEIMIKCWHPHHTKRPGFEDVLRSLLDDEDTVLDIPNKDAATHKKAACLGAELQAGHKMYSHLQTLYIPNSGALTPDRLSSAAKLAPTAVSSRGDKYETTPTDTNSRLYQNIRQDLLKPIEHQGTEEAGDNQWVGTPGQVCLEEALYEKLDCDSTKSEKAGEGYYNVVKLEDEIYTDHIPRTKHGPTIDSIRKQTQPPVPKPRIMKRTSTPAGIPANELVESDYSEAGGSIFSINNDQITV